MRISDWSSDVCSSDLFTDTAQNVVFIGGPGTGKTHLASALAVSGITAHNKRVRFFSTVDLVNLLEREKYDGKAGRIAQGLLRTDLVILDRSEERRGGKEWVRTFRLGWSPETKKKKK